MIIDTHAHCSFDSLAEHEDEMLARMVAAGVEMAIQIAVDAASARTVVDMSRYRPNVYRAVVGIHPNDCQSIRDIDTAMAEIRSIVECSGDVVVGIGETGLDRHYPETGPGEFARQRIFFGRHVSLAREFWLPVVVHSRDAWSETIECLREFRPERLVMHCYLGDLATTQTILGLCPNAWFAFGWATTYRRNEAVRGAAAGLPLDRILVETDAPFLSPEPFRGTINEPANARTVLEFIKTLRSEPGAEVEEIIYRSTKELFGL